MTGPFICIKMTVRCPNCKGLASYYIVPQPGGMVLYSLVCSTCNHESEFSKPLYPVNRTTRYPQALPS